MGTNDPPQEPGGGVMIPSRRPAGTSDAPKWDGFFQEGMTFLSGTKLPLQEDRGGQVTRPPERGLGTGSLDPLRRAGENE